MYNGGSNKKEKRKNVKSQRLYIYTHNIIMACGPGPLL